MKEKIAIISILANVLLAISKILIGYISLSAAVLAEGFHSLTDIFSSVIGYFGIKTSQKPVDREHPYGHYKFEVLSGILIALILFATGVGIIYDAYINYLNPEKIKLDYLVFTVMIFSILINFTTAKIKIYYGKKENSLTLLSDGSHDKADVLASVAVLLGLLLTKYWIFADSFLAFLIGLYIIKESFPLGREAIDSLLDVSAGEKIENEIKLIIQKEKVVIDSLKTQKKGSSITANLEIKLPSGLKVEEATKISENLRNKLMAKIKNLSYIAIQIKSYELSAGFYKPVFGKGLGWQKKGRHKKENEETKGEGPDGNCVCPKCSYSIPHQRGVRCSESKCPKCNVNLERK